MARSAPRALAALRLRPAKAESKPPPESPPKSAPKPAPKATPGSSSKTAKTPRTTKGSNDAKASPKPPGQAPAKRRPFAFLARVLTVLCAFLFMVAFAVILARLTLEPSPASVELTHNNLHPGRSLRAYLDQPELRDAVRQIGGNILLGVPFGVLMPVIAPRTRGVLRVLFLTATVMLMVEVAQGALITGRAFDIDDVILNTTGALIGYLLLGRRVSRAVHAPKRQRA
ncbi:VanZ family protein [Streptomyces turgidiscabies]|uniref:VanZ-like protein n=1 Tax=Streptomyces turgidiscabies (strain Car8) TaxID=698760 RepID=L7EZT4_STRT8|nr:MULTISPECIES: VanZ family protein [Streptomyces]ELP64399.1 VanZ-like protein [Streptomyces turgidiscabies Car8]MDX3491799.1 VanZ family protein [Streptomyces turgidiscabies]GAQ72085.1 VanZ like family protein [Streptomyces turgidiscabies]